MSPRRALTPLPAWGSPSWNAVAMSFLIKVVVNAVAIWVAAAIIPGVDLAEGSAGDTALSALMIGLALTLVNTVVKPVVVMLSFPLYLLTLGLFSFVVNAAMLMLAAWLSGFVGLTFEIDGFWPEALLAAVVVTLVSVVLNLVLRDRK